MADVRDIRLKTPEDNTTYSYLAEGYYLSTYGFDDDDVGSNPSGWNVNEAHGDIKVISEKNNHKKVVEIKDTSSDGTPSISDNFGQRTNGTVEWWWASNLHDEAQTFLGGSEHWWTLPLTIRSNGDYEYYDGSWHDVGVDATAGIFDHHKLVFDCNSDTFDWYINENLVQNDGAFRTSATYLNSIAFHGQWLQNAHKNTHWVDAIGYSWNSEYSTGDNLEQRFPTGYYPGTYGFENDAEGNNPNDWSITESSGSIHVEDAQGGHRNVLYVHSQGDSVIAEQTFSGKSDGTIEWWWYTDNAGALPRWFNIRSEGTDIIRTYMHQGNFICYNGGSQNTVKSLSSNRWYHNKIVFDCNSDTYDWYIDGILEMNNGEFCNGASGVDRVHIATWMAGTQNHWIDAVGYSWDPNYNVGDNYYEGMLINFELPSRSQWDWIECDFDGDIIQVLGDFTIPYPTEGSYDISIRAKADGSSVYHVSDTHSFTVNQKVTILTPNNNQLYTENDVYPDYHGTYSFNTDDVGSNPSGWNVNEAHGDINVISEKNNHKKVVEIKDTSTSGTPSMYDIFEQKNKGTVEWWWASSLDDAAQAYFGGSDHWWALPLTIHSDGDYEWYDGNSWHDVGIDATAGILDHHKIVFDCNSDTFDWYINDNLEVNDGPFATACSYINSFSFNGQWLQNGQKHIQWVDAVGYSWGSDYSIGDNLIYKGLLLSLDSNSAINEFRLYSDGNLLKTITGNSLISSYNGGENSIRLIGTDDFGHTYPSNVVKYSSEPEGWAPKTLIGSERYFPAEENSKLGYTLQTTHGFVQDSLIEFEVCKESSGSESVDINIYVDNELISDVNQQLNGGVKECFSIFTEILKTPMGHVIEIEIDSGQSVDPSEYKLEYLNISRLNFEEYSNDKGAIYTPTNIFPHGNDKDNAVMAINNEVPWANLNGDASDLNYASFFTNFMFFIDPGYSGPNEVFQQYLIFDTVTRILYLNSISMNIKIVDPNGEYISNTEFKQKNTWCVLPSISQDEESYQMIHEAKEVISAITLLASYIPYVDYVATAVDFILFQLPYETPDCAECGLSGSDKAFANWEIANVPTHWGYSPEPKVTERFSMLFSWVLGLSGLSGSYQIVTDISLDIYLSSYGTITSDQEYAFSLSATSYTNFNV